jgi:aspartate oxidase
MQNNPHTETIKTDIAIIGGGSAGITLATKLKHQTAVVIEPKHLNNEMLAGHYGQPGIIKKK